MAAAAFCTEGNQFLFQTFCCCFLYFQLAHATVFSDCNCSFFTCCNSLNNSCRSCGYITAGENACYTGLISIKSLNSASLSLNSVCAVQEIKICFLTDCHHDDICIQSHQVVLIVYRIESSCFIQNLRAVFKYDSTDLAVLVKNFLWTPAVDNLYALFQSSCYFFLVSRHSVSLLKANHSYIGSAQSLSSNCNVHCNVSAADNDYVRARSL